MAVPLPAPTQAAMSEIFAQGTEPIKFFLQQDTGEHFITWLSGKITEHGGVIVTTVPLKGYVLIDPTTEKGKRLRDKWDVADKPNRHVVCYTFVRACIIAGRRLSNAEMVGATPFFLHQYVPVEIFLHNSITESAASALSIDIEKHGGVTETTEGRARVIVAPNRTTSETAVFEQLRHQYEHHTDKYVEDLDWVSWCLDHKRYEHTKLPVKNMGGRKPGSKRTEFTEADDQSLVEYIAKRIPDPAHGGRLGNNLYLDLSNRVSEYPWAARHTWQSWRNRYKQRQLIFDVKIAQWVREHPPSENLKGRMLVQRAERQTSEENGESPVPQRKTKRKRNSITVGRARSIQGAEGEVAEEETADPAGKRPCRSSTRESVTQESQLQPEGQDNTSTSAP